MVSAKSGCEADEAGHVIGTHPLFAPPNDPTIGSGLLAFDAVTRGFCRREYALGIGATGVGKTVMACQLAATFALNGHPGMLITTEQGHAQLERRIYSNFCDIPFARIKDGVNMEKLSPAQQAAIRNLDTQLKNKMEILDWNGDSKKSIVQDLHGEVRGFRDRHGEPAHWLIFDWVGGGLGSISMNDLRYTSSFYESAGDKLASIAREENMAVVAFTQANPGKAANNARIDASCIAECTKMGSSPTTVFGISSIEEDQERVETGALPFKARQYLWVSKSNHGPRLIPVTRRFEFQRFETWDGNPGGTLR